MSKIPDLLAESADQAQDIQFLIKTTSLELFKETGVPQTTEAWCGRTAIIPNFVNKYKCRESMLAEGFRSLIWFHKKPRDGECGNGLTANVEFGPPDAERHATVIGVYFFPHAIGNEVLEKYRHDDKMIGEIRGFTHSRIWPVPQNTISSLLIEVRRKTQKMGSFGKGTK